jgi:cation transport ATPase
LWSGRSFALLLIHMLIGEVLMALLWILANTELGPVLLLRDLSRGTIEEDLIARPAAVESNSGHPFAKAIVAAAGHRNLTRLAVTNFEALAGRGAKALVCNRTE